VRLRDAADSVLVAACLRGEPAAWEALLDRYAALIYSIPLKYGLGEADAADVFQSVCLTLLEKLESLRTPSTLAAWLITTTSRECQALVRRRRRELAHATGEPGLAVRTELPEDELLALERQRVVRAAVSQLTQRCRELIGALFSDMCPQLSYQELAARLGVPINSLGPTRARCLERLRRLLLAAGYLP
jgi:RNA polymerase sigma factor (sigma-70 family)